ncbi:MAG: hypothetical protein ACE5R4_16785, partial [Armatimonadota bacterium]
MRTAWLGLLAGGATLLLGVPAVVGAPWIEADWGDQEPNFPPGSLFWKTRQYPTCPVLFRTVLE